MKHHKAANITTDGRAVLFRSKIDGGGAASLRFDLRYRFPLISVPTAALARRHAQFPHSCSLLKVALFGEIDLGQSE